MVQLLRLLCGALIGLIQSSARREAETLVLRHQINVLRRKSPKRPTLNNADRLMFVWLSRMVPTTLSALTVVTPETVIRWHRAGFRAYWRLRSRPRGGRPRAPLEIRQLIREMSIVNPLWGAPRIQGWRTFLHNHADGIVSMDLFVVPTISFRLLYGFLILQHGRRQILWLGVTAHPTAEWIAGQLTVLLFPRDTDVHREGRVQCRERLGGFLRYYHQGAA